MSFKAQIPIFSANDAPIFWVLYTEEKFSRSLLDRGDYVRRLSLAQRSSQVFPVTSGGSKDEPYPRRSLSFLKSPQQPHRESQAPARPSNAARRGAQWRRGIDLHTSYVLSTRFWVILLVCIPTAMSRKPLGAGSPPSVPLRAFAKAWKTRHWVNEARPRGTLGRWLCPHVNQFDKRGAPFTFFLQISCRCEGFS